MSSCAVPGSGTPAAWPAYLATGSWTAPWPVPEEAMDLGQPWVPLTPALLEGLLESKALHPSAQQALKESLRATLTDGFVALLGPPGFDEALELRLGNHRIEPQSLPLEPLGLGRRAYAFHLDARQQAALVMGSPSLAWPGGNLPIEGPLWAGLRAQLPEVIQFAVTFVDDE